MNLSKNFTLYELYKSSTADRNGFENLPTEDAVENLKTLAIKVLQPIRDEFGSTTVSSGYRSPTLEKVIYFKKVEKLMRANGEKAVREWLSKKSHVTGCAADIEVPGVDNKVLYNWIKDNLEYDQLILEYYIEGRPDSGWVHVSFREGNNRKQSFKIG